MTVTIVFRMRVARLNTEQRPWVPHPCGLESGAGVDAVGGGFDFGDAAEGEQELDEVGGRLLGGLFDNVGNGVGDRGLEHDALGLEAGEVHTHELSGLECRGHGKMVPPEAVKCKLA